MSKNKINQFELLEHLNVLNNLLNADSKMSFVIPDYEVESDEVEVEINMNKGYCYISYKSGTTLSNP